MLNDAAFGAEFRQVRDRTHEGQPVRVLVASRLYATSPDDLWTAVTDRERLPRWFAPVTGEFEQGGRFQVEGNASGTIVRCDNPRALEVTWEYGEHVSWVHVTLVAEEGGTRLTLKHLSPKDPASEKHWKQYGPGAGGVGWDLAFHGLATYFDSDGKGMDQKASHEWMVSESGKHFMKQSADEWRVAHVEAGEDPSVAQEMASRTADFYTGT